LTAPSTWETLPELIEAAREPSLRDASAHVSGNVAMYVPKKQVPAGVTRLLQDKDPGVRCVAAWFLHGCRAVEIKEALAVFEEALASSDPWARRQGVQFLGKLGAQSRAAAPAIKRLLDDRDEGVRDAAAKALKDIQRK